MIDLTDKTLDELWELSRRLDRERDGIRGHLKVVNDEITRRQREADAQRRVERMPESDRDALRKALERRPNHALVGQRGAGSAEKFGRT